VSVLRTGRVGRVGANSLHSKYFASFGGLLLYMEGPHRKLSGLKIDDIYMLIKHS
jgi:DNA-directed RNA polymerase I, II, and III subunit RPABC3